MTNTMYNLKELMDDLNTGEIGEKFSDYNDGYVCDIIAEIADSSVDIYNSDLWEWAKDNEEWIEEAISSGIYTVESSNFDLIRLFQAGQYEFYTHDLYENLDDSIKYAIYSHLIYGRKMEEINEELSDFIDELCTDIDNNKRLDFYIDSVDEFIDGENEDEEEDEDDD